MARRIKGEGSIVQLPDGRWRAIAYIDGKRVAREARTKDLAGDELKELVEAARIGVIPERSTVEAWMRHWIEHVDDHAPKTKEGYVALCRSAIWPTIGAIRLDKLRPESLETLYKSMREGTHRPAKTRADGTTETVQPLAPASVVKAHRIIHRALKVAMQRGNLARNVADLITPPKGGRAHTDTLSTQDAQAVMKRAIADGQGARWALSIMLGLRPGEALGLTWDCVEGDRLHVRQQLQQISGKGLVLSRWTKTSEGMRTIPIPEMVSKLLTEQRKRQLNWMAEQGPDWKPWVPPGESDPVLTVFTDERGHPIRPRFDATLWSRILSGAGVPYQRPYVGRHTAASLLIAEGVEVSVVAAQLGHTDSSFTMRTYVHPLADKQRAAANAMGALFS